MKYEAEFTVTWTDGGSPSTRGYFDGAGSMNDLLLSIFAGHEDWHREGPPVGVDVMSKVFYGTKLKIRISLEVLNDHD